MNEITVKKEFVKDMKKDQKKQKDILPLNPGMFFYDVYKTLSYDHNGGVDVFASVGGRGIGKTFGWKYVCIRDFIEKGYQFFYLRRWKTELKNSDQLFSDVIQKFPGYAIKCEKGRVYIKRKTAKKWLHMGYVDALSQVKTLKGANYPEVMNILLDEFQITNNDKKTERYMKNEFAIFSDFYTTVARLRPVRIILLSNARSVVNPYFTAFKIKPKDCTKGFHRITATAENGASVNVLLEVCESDNYAEEAKKSRSGRLTGLAGSLAESSINNTFIDDDMTNIEKPEGKYIFILNLYINKKYYGCYQNENQDIYFDDKGNPTSKQTFCCSQSDLDKAEYYIKSTADHPHMKILKMLMNKNKIYYKNINTKTEVGTFFLNVGIIK